MLRGLFVGLVAWLPAGGAVAADPLDGDGIVEMIFDPWSSRLAATETAKFDRLAGVLSQIPGSRLQILVGDTGDAAMHRFLAARLAVVEAELARRGLAGERVRQDRPLGLERMVALRVLRPAPPPEPPPTPPPAPPPAPPMAASPAVAEPQSLLPSPSPGATALPPPVARQDMWTAPAGRHLKAVLEDWAQRGGWTVVWQSDRDYPIEATASFTGDFTDAAQQLISALANVAPAPFGSFYKGNRVLLVHSGEGR